MSPEFGELSPAAGRCKGEGVVGSEDPGRNQQVKVGVPGEEVPEGLGGDHDAGLAVGTAGAFPQPKAEHLMGGVKEFSK